jgi:hypothetical protein
MPSIKVYGSSNNSIKSEEITKLLAISFEITNEITNEITKIPEESEITKIPEIQEIQETPRFYSPKYIFRDLEEFKEYKFTNLK